MNVKGLLNNNKVNNLLKYSSIKYIALIIGFVKGIINAKVLGPDLLGVVGNLLLVLSYISYSNFGIIYSMNREYVIYESKNKIEEAKKVLKTSFTALSILSMILIMIGICTKFIYKGDLGYYLLLTFIVGMLEQFKSYYINYFRLVNDLRKINNIEIINNILSFVLIVISIAYFKIYSVLISLLIADIIIFIYGYKNSKKINLSIEMEILKNLLIVGIPLLIYNLGYYILTTVDRIMIIKYLGNKDLGYFTFSNQIVGGTLVFITSILFLYYPKAIKALNTGNGIKIEEILYKTEQYTKYVEILGVTLCVAGALLIKPFVNLIVPQFSISINIYRILLYGTIANQIAYFSNVFIVSNKKQKYLIYLQLVTIILAFIFNFTFIKFGMGIMGVSIATLITNIFYSIMQHLIYLKILKMKGSKIKNVIKVYTKFIIFIFLSIVLSIINLSFLFYSVLIIILTFTLYAKDIRRTLKVLARI